MLVALLVSHAARATDGDRCLDRSAPVGADYVLPVVNISLFEQRSAREQQRVIDALDASLIEHSVMKLVAHDSVRGALDGTLHRLLELFGRHVRNSSFPWRDRGGSFPWLWPRSEEGKRRVGYIYAHPQTGADRRGESCAVNASCLLCSAPTLRLHTVCAKHQLHAGCWRRACAEQDPTTSDPDVGAALAPVFLALRTHLLPVLERLLGAVFGVREGDLRLGFYRAVAHYYHTSTEKKLFYTPLAWHSDGSALTINFETEVRRP